jgi:hypothetical protein
MQGAALVRIPCFSSVSEAATQHGTVCLTNAQSRQCGLGALQGFTVLKPAPALLQGMMEGGLSAAGMRGGQTPQISANYAFDMNTSLQM